MPRPRLYFDRWPAALYAIGDVHGCLPQLLEIERQIEADATGVEGEKWIVMLGDYVDRGPQSAQVLDHLLQPAPPGFERFCLMGNHEQMMLDFLDDPLTNAYWLEQGGLETLQSYGRHSKAASGRGESGLPGVRQQIPADHLRFLDELAVGLSLPGWIFVHAGIRPGRTLAEQTDEDLLWIREPFLSGRLVGAPRVVHGHTPSPEPEVTPYRVCLDTQCFFTGRLTAARITQDGELSFLATTGQAAKM